MLVRVTVSADVRPERLHHDDCSCYPSFDVICVVYGTEQVERMSRNLQRMVESVAGGAYRANVSLRDVT